MDKARIYRGIALLLLVCLSFSLLGAVTREMRPVGTLSVEAPEEEIEEMPVEPTPEPTPEPTEAPAAEPENTPEPPVTPSAEEREPEVIVPAPAKSSFCNDTYCGAYMDVGGTPYICVQGVFAALDESAHFEMAGNVLYIESENISVTICADWKYFICNDRYLYTPKGILWQEDGVYVPAAEIAKCFGAVMSLEEETEYLHINVDTIVPLASGSEFYNEDDLYWLSHVIYAESGCESLKGQIAVGNVVLNRVASPIFVDQDDIYSVIFASGQFEVVKNRSIYLDPDEEAILAAKIALEGYEILPGALFFAQGYMGSGYRILDWIGAHCFMTLA